MDAFTTASPPDVAAFYSDLTEPHTRAMVDFLAEHAGQRFEARAIMETLGFAEHADVARTAYSVGRIARKHSLSRPWNEAQMGYMMSSEVAALLQQTS